jgi:hypothetical protein
MSSGAWVAVAAAFTVAGLALAGSPHLAGWFALTYGLVFAITSIAVAIFGERK